MLSRKSGRLQNDLTIDFGLFSRANQPPKEDLFQKVKSQMLKRKEQYEKLEHTLQDKLKHKEFKRKEERVQVVMLQKCKNYFHVRTPIRRRTPHVSRHENSKRPETSTCSVRASASPTSVSFIDQLQVVMDDCNSEKNKIRENMGLFSYYCRMMDRRLVGIRNTIEKKERMV